jgi:hypothetical protein
MRGGRGAGRPSERPTKADRKDEARRERDEIRRQMAKRRRARTAGLIGGLLAAAVVVVAVAALGGSGNTDGTSGGQSGGDALPGLLTTPAPWDANNDLVSDRISIITLPPFLDQEGVGAHSHVRVFLYVGGNPMPVPADIGVVNGVPLSPLHTHDTTGTLHVETSDPTYVGTLGQFFDVWGVRLSSTCLGGDCADGADLRLRAYVNGAPYDGDPRQIPLTDQSAIVLVFGTADQLPDPIPGSFTFGA